MTDAAPTPDAAPVLPGYIERRTRGVAGPAALLLRVWCQWCCSWHTHGLAGATPGDVTDRAAHCFAPDSPYEQTGYRIRVAAAPFFTVRSTLQQATRNQRAAIRRGRVSAAVQRLRDQPVRDGWQDGRHEAAAHARDRAAHRRLHPARSGPHRGPRTG